jgi:hypothetical protein
VQHRPEVYRGEGGLAFGIWVTPEQAQAAVVMMQMQELAGDPTPHIVISITSALIRTYEDIVGMRRSIDKVTYSLRNERATSDP